MRKGLVLATIVASWLTGGAVVQAQCVLDLKAEFDPLVTTFPTSDIEVRTTGTYDCAGAFTGTVCSLGTLDGSCTDSTSTGRTVTCTGGCDFETPPDGDPQPVCVGGETSSEGSFESDCAAGLCVVETTGDDGTTSLAVLATDAEDMIEATSACGGTQDGITEVDFLGVTTIPVPAPW